MNSPRQSLRRRKFCPRKNIPSRSNGYGDGGDPCRAEPVHLEVDLKSKADKEAAADRTKNTIRTVFDIASKCGSMSQLQEALAGVVPGAVVRHVDGSADMRMRYQGDLHVPVGMTGEIADVRI